MKVENTDEKASPTADAPKEMPPHKLRQRITMEELLEGVPEDTCLGEI